MTPDDLASEVRSAIHRFHITDQHVVIAVSGGVDSVVLLHTITLLAAENNITLSVAHANHALRGADSDDDERFVASIAQSHGTPFSCDRLDVTRHARATGLGIEGAARELRYAFLTKVARDRGANVVLTAHNMDDNAETMLMNVARGSGTQGLSGIPPERELENGVRLIRPLLTVSRSHIKNAAEVWGLQWREDSSNSDLHYLRNKVRAEILPAMRTVFGPAVTARILRSSELVRDANSVLQKVIEELLPSIVRFETDDTCVFLIDAMHGLPRGLVRELFRTAMNNSYADVLRLTSLLDAEVGSRASLSDGRSALREREHIIIQAYERNPLPSYVVIHDDGVYVAGSQTLEVQKRRSEDIHPHADAQIAYIELRSIRGALLWRTWQDGDRFTPFGFDGSVLVSDLLTNLRIPHATRRSVRVVCDDEGILWVCGARSAERTRITSTTTEILILRVST